MPQLFQVLRCYQCLVFQIHQLKKTNKWQCKICGEKQSLKRHYGLGNSKECRLHVQKLNGIREEIEDERCNNKNSDIDSSDSAEDNNDINLIQKETKTKSKWDTYIENEGESTQEVNKSMYLGSDEVCLEIQRKSVKSKDNKRKKIISLTSDTAYKTNNFKTPYKYESNEASTPMDNELIKPIKKSKSNTVDTDEIIYKHKVVPILKEQGYNKYGTSKWTQFVETDDLKKKDECSAQYHTVPSVTALFQLCDDSDLDVVLSV